MILELYSFRFPYFSILVEGIYYFSLQVQKNYMKFPPGAGSKGLETKIQIQKSKPIFCADRQKSIFAWFQIASAAPWLYKKIREACKKILQSFVPNPLKQNVFGFLTENNKEM